jgi:hypothetical protein
METGAVALMHCEGRQGVTVRDDHAFDDRLSSPNLGWTVMNCSHVLITAAATNRGRTAAPGFTTIRTYHSPDCDPQEMDMEPMLL